jgi:chromosome segregation ATPase
MKLMEFFNQARELGADKNDPLMSIVADLNKAKEHLDELRNQSQKYLTTGMKAGKPVALIDPVFVGEAEATAKEIESCKTRITELEGKIAKVDEVCSKNHIHRPLLKALRRELNESQTSIVKYRKKISAELGNLLLIKGLEEEEAKKHPDYRQAVANFETRKRQLEPKIQQYAAAIAELEVI